MADASAEIRRHVLDRERQFWRLNESAGSAAAPALGGTPNILANRSALIQTLGGYLAMDAEIGNPLGSGIHSNQGAKKWQSY